MYVELMFKVKEKVFKKCLKDFLFKFFNELGQEGRYNLMWPYFVFCFWRSDVFTL